MSAETRTTRVSETELAEHLSTVLDRVASGEHLTIHRAGKAIAVIGPPRQALPERQASQAPAAHGESVFDEEFERHVREHREWANSARVAEWPD